MLCLPPSPYVRIYLGEVFNFTIALSYFIPFPS